MSSFQYGFFDELQKLAWTSGGHYVNHDGSVTLYDSSTKGKFSDFKDPARIWFTKFVPKKYHNRFEYSEEPDSECVAVTVPRKAIKDPNLLKSIDRDVIFQQQLGAAMKKTGAATSSTRRLSPSEGGA